MSRGDLLVRDGRIAAVGSVCATPGTEAIDCAGMVVSPGFIDVHSHSDLQVLDSRREKLLQGVTTEVVGNCGFSPYPCGGHADELRSFANGIFCGGQAWGWSSAEEYLADANAYAHAARVYSLLGHGSLRIAVRGNRMEPVSEDEIVQMEELLREALTQGAVGFSTGLMYAPGSSAGEDELTRLCTVVAECGAIYTTHMRDYGFRLIEAIDEQIALAERSGCRLQISHLQAVGKPNRDLNERALERIEEARARGIDVAFDCYPYIAGSTVMTQLLPQWALAGGVDPMLARLSDADERGRIAEEMRSTIANDWSELLVSAVASADNAACVGRTIEELAAARGREAEDVIFDLLIEERGEVNILEYNQSEENLRRNVTHPLAIIISDGFYVKGRPHPRLHGTFPELLGRMCRDLGWLPLETAIHKITGYPAERFGMKEIGLLREGYLADVTIFDPQRIRSHASYDDPERAPEGIEYVLREGRILLEPASQTR